MMKVLLIAGLAVAQHAFTASESTQRWGVWELNLTGPVEGNPFLDQEFGATFTLSNAEADEVSDPLIPLVAFDFKNGDATHVTNGGSSKSSYPAGDIIGKALRSDDLPAGASGDSMDMGSDVTTRHVIELPGNKKPFKDGLVGLRSFTITGWIKVRDDVEGPGGNRVVNFCNGGGGIDLVWDAGGGGRLKLAVNEWPDGNKPQSSDGSVPPSAHKWPLWRFFAVTYDDASKDDNVNFYFGTSVDAATLDTGAVNAKNYSRGAVEDPKLPLAFGNFGSGFKKNDRMLRGLLYQPRIFTRALTASEVVSVQHRSGCKPSCPATGATCGSDGCGGSCGVCSGASICTDRGMPTGQQRCQMPTTVTVPGFYDGAGVYKVRFSPPYTGTWDYTTRSSTAPELDGKKGTFAALAPTGNNHGPVQSVGYKLVYADGTPHISVGSTCYQWSSKDFAMQAQTLATLRSGQGGKGQIFNKLRMTVFPKWYQFNHANPVETGTAYEILPKSLAANATNWGCVGSDCTSVAGSFDLTRFNVTYWRNYEFLVGSMQEMGVVADIIVFHPYDNGHWGFDCMGGRDPSTYNTTYDKIYLRYLSARMSAFSNVWWAMANEWSFCRCKSINATVDDGPSPVWDELFETLYAADPYGRQMSIHNGNLLYNHSQPWISHVSLQGNEDDTPLLRAKYGKPTVWDEVKYEGDISSGWGALSGQEETDRFWWGASLGVHVGHSETVLRPEISDDDSQPLWWAKGGTLIGTSPPRIKWFRSLWEEGAGAQGSQQGSQQRKRPAFGELLPTQEYFGDSDHDSFVANVLSHPTGLYYFLHFLRPGRWIVPLKGSGSSGSRGSGNGEGGWELRSLDYWTMQTTVVQTLPASAVNVTVDVSEIPGNFEIAKVGGY